MDDAGITPEFKRGEGIVFGPNGQGKPHRFHVSGESKGTRNGWYVLFGDGLPAGEFGNWKTGHRVTWCAKGQDELTPEEKRAIADRMAKAKAAREKEQREREGDAAKTANLVWNDATEVHGYAHPYLARKGVQSYGLRSAPWPCRDSEGETYRHIDGALLVPVMNIAGKIMSLQSIFPAKDAAMGRDKDFLSGGRKAGGFFMIGTPPPAGGTVCIVEGYATAATIHASTGWCCVVAFDAYNLVAVAKVMREAMPACLFIVAADNDQWTMTPVENPGVTYATRAAAEIHARLVVPQFADLDGRPTDFNDLEQREGSTRVQAQLLPPVAPVAKPSGDLVPTAPTGTIEPIEPDSVDIYTPFPDINGKGAPLATIRNASEMLRRLNVTVRYNVIAKRVEVIIPGAINSIDNQMNAAMATLTSWCKRFRMPTESFADYVLAIADANQYNPVATWITSKPWDGRSRLEEFYATVVERTDVTLPDGRSLKKVLMRKWLLSAVAAAFSPEGVVARGVLTFVSKQNLGKTYWAKRLAPRDLRLVMDGVILDPSERDSVKKCVSNWIVELGEVDATFRKADIAALKAFISMERDVFRAPYARAESEFARRTVFVASVNNPKFLHDETGNSRFWTIHAQSLNNSHDIDVQQMWAEMLTIFQSGETWHLSKMELEALNEHNEDYESITPIHELIDKKFDWDSMPTLWTVPMRATEIAQRVGVDRPNKSDVNLAAAYVEKQYNVQTAKKGKERSKVWLMPREKHERDSPF
ncbi:MAG TPA: VapE domain-containing protein [Pyrinomonadaceae bacterium]|nr:VapE domain-containing protein [Pyrinomonadaceae bacterium]